MVYTILFLLRKQKYMLGFVWLYTH